jgi:hypothetical protein
MNFIKNKLSDSYKVIEHFSEYFQLLKPLIEGKYTDETEQLDNIIAQYPAQQEKIEKQLLVVFELIDENKKKHSADEKKQIDAIFTLYKNLQDFYLSMENIAKYFNQAHLQSENIDEYGLSQTYKLEAADQLTKLLSQYTNFLKKYKDNDADIITYLNNILLSIVLNGDEKTAELTKEQGDKLFDMIKYIQEKFYNAKNTVQLYAKFLQTFIDVIYSRGSVATKILFDILDLIEIDKDFFISGNVQNTLGKAYADIHKVNPPLKRFSLVPGTVCMPLTELLSIILLKPTTGKIDLKKYSVSEDVCFIKMNRIVYTPVEYNLRPLVIESVAKPLLVSEDFGVNKKIVDRFKTIKLLETDKWDFSYEIIGKLDTATGIYCLETLDGANYRALVFDMKATTYLLDKSKLTHLINYITKEVTPTRVSNYHAVQIKSAIGNMFLRRPLNIDIMEETAKDIDTQVIRNELFLQVTNYIADSIKKNYDSGKSIADNSDINDILHDDKIREVFANTLLKLYRVGSKIESLREFDAGKFPFSELLSSYLLDLSVILMRFMRELHDGYNRNPFGPEVFELPSMDKVSSIRKQLDNLVLNVLNQIISDKENIYASLNYKYLLLNFY